MSHVESLGVWLDLILAGAGIVTLVVTIWRKSVKAANKMEDLEKVSTLADIVDELNELVSHELNHNSGKSVKDRATQAAQDSKKAVEISAETRDVVMEMSKNLQAFTISSITEHQNLWSAIHDLRGRDES